MFLQRFICLFVSKVMNVSFWNLYSSFIGLKWSCCYLLRDISVCLSSSHQHFTEEFTQIWNRCDDMWTLCSVFSSWLHMWQRWWEYRWWVTLCLLVHTSSCAHLYKAVLFSASCPGQICRLKPLILSNNIPADILFSRCGGWSVCDRL